MVTYRLATPGQRVLAAIEEQVHERDVKVARLMAILDSLPPGIGLKSELKFQGRFQK
jgi:hypothetical protein